MIKVDDKVREEIQKDSRRFNAKIFVEESGKRAEVSGVIRALALYKGSCGGSSFEPGSIFSNYCECEIDYCGTYLCNKTAVIQLGVKVDGEYKYFDVMTVYITNVSKKAKRTKFTAYGVIGSKLGKKYSGESYTSVFSLLKYIETVAECKITLDDGLSDLAIPSIELNKYYYKEIIGLVAGLYFGYAAETADGNIIISTYNKSGNSLEAFPSRILNYGNFYGKTEVCGVAVSSTEKESFIMGELQNASMSNPLMTKTAFEAYAKNYVGFKYEPFDMELSLGDFTVEPWDVVKITDLQGEKHELLPMSIKHTFSGGLSTSISAPTLATGEDHTRDIISQESSFSYDKILSGDLAESGSGEETAKSDYTVYYYTYPSGGKTYNPTVLVRNGIATLSYDAGFSLEQITEGAYIVNRQIVYSGASGIPGRFKPAFPITITCRGTTKDAGSLSSSYPVIVKYTLHDETGLAGTTERVLFTAFAALIDPKSMYSWKGMENYLCDSVNCSFCITYPLASEWDKLKPKEKEVTADDKSD